MRVKSEAKRNSILQAALTVFQRHGFEGSAMDEIARQAGCSKATLYSYYPSKEALFMAAMDAHCASRFTDAFANLRYDGNLEASLQDFGLALLPTLLADDLLAMRRSVMAEAGSSPVGKLFYERGPKQGQGRLADFLQTQMQAGRLRQADAWRCARHLLSLLEGDFLMLAMLDVSPRPTREVLAEHVAEVVAVFLCAYLPTANA
ncbi:MULTISPECIES: TetR/AcrR family transcriptional regulator C-terminal domain-containing protein [unclassified Paludibacterium]|uniref:TetR/AcrR family transcriptional regulator C-terminal domain-containing protein n=1 Tax=unclassified Paludibacterium TaxID=2618429 RepID=UPI001C0509C9|nr:TetR/AcrR family transcriptional regulator C-terminal domain-containing protein [Paludibacterium sp. B53371]BEV71759.1 TetR family multidrug efflux transcriptional regulator VceR [Paludibacterium sp. THUN1379]